MSLPSKTQQHATPTRVERRTLTSLKCKHCHQIKPATEMSRLSCESLSDCCRSCWQLFLEENPWFHSEQK